MSATDHLRLPSPVVTAQIQFGNKHLRIGVPKQEVWRIRQIFQEHEYGGVSPQALRPSPVIVDIGANIGVFAAYARLAFCPGIIHCFEPSPPSVELLRRNVAQFPNVTVHPIALGTRDAEADLYLDADNSGANTIKVGQVRNSGGHVSVPIRNAGAIWDELSLVDVDVLKIDTEGCEVEILEALGKRLARTRVVMAEYHSPTDRRRIDALLPDHVLFGAIVYSLRLGVVKYIRADLVDSEAHPDRPR